MIVATPRPAVKTGRVMGAVCRRLFGWVEPSTSLVRPSLDQLAAPDYPLPEFVKCCPVAMAYLARLGDLPWSQFPERPTSRPWPGPAPAARAPFVAAFLVKIDRSLRYMSQLRTFLAEHPALVWVLGFELVAAPDSPHSFDVEASLPSRRQLGRVLRELDNASLQWLLDAAVQALAAAVPDELLGDTISLDTKHILAWVVENNPKSYVTERFNPEHQPAGDPDCRLGCKSRHNTPPTEGVPASEVSSGEYYWGYASGVVATHLADDTEIVLAELTQTFDRHDITYFQPLMADTERRLGRRPRYGALDAAYDAFYVYDYFHEAGGFAAVPLVARGGVAERTFDPAGNPLCAAGLAMHLKRTFVDRAGHVPHECGLWTCPLAAGSDCPAQHAKAPRGGCQVTSGTTTGARIRYQLDRHSPAYKHVYNQRTATERINSQATELGIERPKLRNQAAIANHNTLLYVLLDLRALDRVRLRQAERQQAA